MFTFTKIGLYGRELSCERRYSWKSIYTEYIHRDLINRVRIAMI
jgi:hypothetical protein